MDMILKGVDAMLVAISRDYGLDIEELRTKYGVPREKKVKEEKRKCKGLTAKGEACKFAACVGSEMCKKHMKCVVIEEEVMKVPPNTPCAKEKESEYIEKKTEYIEVSRKTKKSPKVPKAPEVPTVSEVPVSPKVPESPEVPTVSDTSKLDEEMDALEEELKELSKEEMEEILEQAETPPSKKKVNMMKQTQAYKNMMEMEEIDE